MKHKVGFSLFLILFVFLTLSVLSLSYVRAEDSADEKAEEDQEKIEDLEDDIKKYEKKLESLRGKEQTLSGEIEYSDSQIALTELRIQTSIANIAKKEKEITKLANDIEDLKLRIVKLEKSIDYQRVLLGKRLREKYKSYEESPIVMLLGPAKFLGLVQKDEYLAAGGIQDQKLMVQMDQTKTAYSQQKNLVEEKKSEEEVLKTQIESERANLESYQNELESQKEEKRRLLEITQNDSAKYQKLLEEAKQQLASFKGFTSTAGGGVIDSNAFGKGKEGWYYSQRDERWAGKRIGTSNEVVLDVGCLVTSVSMVFKSQGRDSDPADIAKKNNYYLSGTAYMIIPGDFSTYWGNYSAVKSRIDDSLEDGVPVIVGLRAGPYGTHFVVLSDKKNGDYVMYDPWYGPDLYLSDYYGTGSIYEAVIYN